MTIIAGALSVRDDWSPGELASQLAKDSCRYDFLESKAILCSARLACYVIEDRQQRGEEIKICKAGEKGYLLGEIAAPMDVAECWLSSFVANKPESYVPPDGLWIAIAYNELTGCLRLTGDQLGVSWLYVASLPSGYAFCSDFGALASNLPCAVTIDDETALVTLVLGYSPDNRTCFKEIAMLAPGTVVKLEPDGMVALPKRKAIYGDRYASKSTSEKYSIMGDLFDQGLEAWCKAEPADLVISLSDGYDSRFALALTQKMGLAAPCVTFGNWRSSTAREAKRISKHGGTTTNLYQADSGSWNAWRRCVEQTGAVGGYHNATGWTEGWLRFIGGMGKRAMIGFLGDSLSGKHLVGFEGEAGDWLERWCKWNTAEGWIESPLLRPNIRRNAVELLTNRFEVLCNEAIFQFPHQRALHLDWYGRQRRFIGSQPNLMGRFLSPLTFFYTADQLEFWSNLPFRDLQDQFLYRSFAEEQFPRLFPAKAPPTIAKRLWGAGKNAVLAARPQLKSVLAPDAVNREKIILENRTHICNLMEESQAFLGHWFDPKKMREAIEGFPQVKQVTTYQLIRLINILLLLRLGRLAGLSETHHESAN